MRRLIGIFAGSVVRVTTSIVTLSPCPVCGPSVVGAVSACTVMDPLAISGMLIGKFWFGPGSTGVHGLGGASTWMQRVVKVVPVSKLAGPPPLSALWDSALSTFALTIVVPETMRSNWKP